MKIRFFWVAAALALTSAGCSTLNMDMASSAGIKMIQAATISDAQVEQYVGDYVRQLDAQSNIAAGNDPYAVRMNRIAGPINDRDGINIKVYKTPDVNAFAVADGSVRVYSGLMDIMSDEEILGVIGHEIGHVKLHHTREAFKHALMSSALRDGIASTGGVAATLSQSELGDLAEAMSESGYSRQQEKAADNYGYDFLKSHGLNPWAMAMAFEKLEQMEQSAGYSSGPVQQLFSTHPDIAARITAMEKRAEKDGYARPGAGGSPGVPTGSATGGKWNF